MNGISRGNPDAPAAAAFIREAECIGCARCLPVCPVDAILGAPGMMHTVIKAECTGCGLCLAPCPVDCIEMRALPEPAAQVDGDLSEHRRRREEYHEFRLANPDPRLWPKAGGGFSREAARREIAAATARAAARRKRA